MGGGGGVWREHRFGHGCSFSAALLGDCVEEVRLRTAAASETDTATEAQTQT